MTPTLFTQNQRYPWTYGNKKYQKWRFFLPFQPQQSLIETFTVHRQNLSLLYNFSSALSFGYDVCVYVDRILDVEDM